LAKGGTRRSLEVVVKQVPAFSAGLAFIAASVSVASTSVSVASPAGGSETRESEVIRTYIVAAGGDCVFPESIDVQDGKFYTGGLCDGNLYRGDLDRRRAAVFVPAGERPRAVAGIKATATRLVVARGGGRASVFDRVTGKRVARFATGLGNKSTLNDVAIAPDGDAYLTDFRLSKIYRISARAIANRRTGVQKLRVFNNLRGTVFPVEEDSANGIAVTRGGRFLLVGHFSADQLYRVRLSNGHVHRVRLHDGMSLDHPDGITLRGQRTAYVVEFGSQSVAKVRLSTHYDSGRIVSRTKRPRFQWPTSAAIAGDRLLVVNSQFGGPGVPPWTVSSIPLP